MADFFATVAGYRTSSLSLYVPPSGPWIVEAELDEVHDVSGRVEVALGGLTLSGTVQPNESGTFALSTRVKVVAGAGGWATRCTPRHYHNDAGVKARTVAEDAARIAGETMAEFPASATTLGPDYVRRTVEASRVLEDTARGVPWWVDYQGRTHVAERSTQPPGEDVELINYDPVERIAHLTMRDPLAVGVGTVIADERLGADQTIRELEFTVSDGELRAWAWTGGGARSSAKIAGLLTAIARRATSGRIHGVYRYRVFEMAPDGRVRLQAVRRIAGLPDVLPVEQWPGVPGVENTLTGGTEVLVQFIEGDPTMPVLTGYATAAKGTPISVAFDRGSRPMARVGDQVQLFLGPVPVPLTGTVGGSPFVGVATFTATPMVGIISTGNPKVKA